ncbi:PTS system mannose/fructose/N-acetylgalactosamine-transporter subunit IIB [Candidatus Latescibacterota bacterium]
MSIVLARVDDRLIHGQVMEGWGKKLHPDLVVVVSDEIATAEWQSDICLCALPRNIHGMVVSVHDAPRIIRTLLHDPRRTFVLFESPHDAYQVILDGAPLDMLNVGGMHSVKGKREVLDYLYLDDNDANYLKAMSEMGVSFDFRDVPEHENVDVLSRIT